MFDIGWSELVVIAVVAIVVIGPKDLPGALRAFGRWTGKLKRMARDFQGQFSEALREAELDDLKNIKKEMTDIGKEAVAMNDGIRTELAKTDADMMRLKSDKTPAEPAPVVAGDPKP